jgi:hypothetical protein
MLCAWTGSAEAPSARPSTAARISMKAFMSFSFARKIPALWAGIWRERGGGSGSRRNWTRS